MSERWTCTRCSAQNESWAISCSSCGLLRADLSVAGPQPRPTVEAAPPPDAAPTEVGGTEAAEPIAVPPWAATTQTAPPTADAASPIGWNAETPAPVAKPPLWKRLPLGLIVFVGFLAIGGIGGLIFNASRSDEGEITKGGNLEVTDLRVGDCWDLKDPNAQEIGEVTAVPCATEHEYEMFFLGAMPTGAYPSDGEFNAWLADNCVPAFETYVGKPYEESELEIFSLTPTTAGWNAADRSVQCAVYHPRIHRLTESLKGSAR